jgi:hypothetical protein
MRPVALRAGRFPSCSCSRVVVYQTTYVITGPSMARDVPTTGRLARSGRGGCSQTKSTPRPSTARREKGSHHGNRARPNEPHASARATWYPPCSKGADNDRTPALQRDPERNALAPLLHLLVPSQRFRNATDSQLNKLELLQRWNRLRTCVFSRDTDIGLRDGRALLLAAVAA